MQGEADGGVAVLPVPRRRGGGYERRGRVPSVLALGTHSALPLQVPAQRCCRTAPAWAGRWPGAVALLAPAAGSAPRAWRESCSRGWSGAAPSVTPRAAGPRGLSGRGRPPAGGRAAPGSGRAEAFGPARGAGGGRAAAARRLPGASREQARAALPCPALPFPAGRETAAGQETCGKMRLLGPFVRVRARVSSAPPLRLLPGLGVHGRGTTLLDRRV